MSEESACIFCLILAGKIPAVKIYETEKTLAFLDINPVADGHTLVIPKVHGRTILDIPEDYLRDIGPVLQIIARATGAKDYNILQNNGKLAFQHVDHVHFHVVPKPNDDEGLKLKLGVVMVQKQVTKEQLATVAEEMKARITVQQASL